MDFENMVKLTEFCKERDVSAGTVTTYLSRHPEIKEHIFYDKKNKNTAYLDDEAVKMLSEKYRMTTTIITDTKLYEKILENNDKMQQLLDCMLDMSKKLMEKDKIIAELQEKERLRLEEASQLTLEDKQAIQQDNDTLRKELEAIKSRMAELENNNQIYPNGEYGWLQKRRMDLNRWLRKSDKH